SKRLSFKYFVFITLDLYPFHSSSDFNVLRVFVEPPSFSKRVESVTAVLGNAVKLQGTIKGSAPITVKWMKDSEILRDDDPNIKMVFENNVASLCITAVAINHGGKYSCQAENEAGQQKCECTCSVTVLGYKQKVLKDHLLIWNALCQALCRLLSSGIKMRRRFRLMIDINVHSLRMLLAWKSLIFTLEMVEVIHASPKTKQEQSSAQASCL
uniref:Ig-like domain-containing protein n=1 Tax=Xiphophorus maculatus TaxID=8083 RepID=A0A3B5QAK3_XIPMA